MWSYIWNDTQDYPNLDACTKHELIHITFLWHLLDNVLWSWVYLVLGYFKMFKNTYIKSLKKCLLRRFNKCRRFWHFSRLKLKIKLVYVIYVIENSKNTHCIIISSGHPKNMTRWVDDIISLKHSWYKVVLNTPREVMNLFLIHRLIT